MDRITALKRVSYLKNLATAIYNEKIQQVADGKIKVNMSPSDLAGLVKMEKEIMELERWIDAYMPESPHTQVSENKE